MTVSTWKRLTLTLCLAALLPTPALAGRRPANLVKNAGAESGGKSPSSWERGQPVSGVEYLWDAKGGVDGGRALSLKKTLPRYFPIAEWVQELRLKGKPRRLHVGALIRAEEAYKAVLDVQFEDRDGNHTHRWAAYVGARDSGDPPANHDWRWYSGIVEVPEKIREVRVALQIYGPGQVWFDDVMVKAVDDDAEVTDAARLTSLPANQAGARPQVGTEAPSAPPTRGQGSGSPHAEDIKIGGDENRRYFLIQADPPGQAPAEGHRLLVVVPGGDGSADFHSFVQRIARNALPAGYLVAQAVAPRWRDKPDIVWPTKTLPDRKMKFPTEDFLEAIIEDVAGRHELDRRHIFTLGWSSGGPPCYAASLQKDTPITGTFVAMSVFKPETLPALKRAAGHAYYVLHSPQDFIAMRFPEAAVEELRAAGARTVLQTYQGGHGWHGDPYGNIAAGVRWLEESVARGSQ